MLPRIVRGLTDLLAPPCCAACRAPLSLRALGFCAGCALLIDEVMQDPGSLDDAACVYGGPLAEAISALKYGGRSEVSPGLAELMRPRAMDCAGTVDVVCCVPLHGARLRERGYNQSALLALPLSRALGLPFRPGLLRRTRATQSQAGLDRVARSQNLIGAFAVPAPLRRQRVLVIDDVATTYATLTEVRRVLLDAGATAVRTLVLARTEREQVGPHAF